MSLVLRELSFEDLASAATSAEDRRTHDRLKLMKSVHISSIDSTETQETATVVDISREGMYFTVRSRHYCIGMEMKVTIASLGFQGICRIVRLEELPGGFLGIGCLVSGW